MQVPTQYIDQFEAYVRGELSAKETEAFEAQLRYDSEMAEAFEVYKAVESGIKDHYRAEMKSRLKEVDRKMDRDKKPTSKTTRLVWITSAVAASVLIGLLAISLFREDRHTQLAQKYWPEEEGLPVKMSAKSAYDDAMNAFKLGQWQEAERQLNAIPASDTTAYYLGNVYFKQAQFKKAATAFKSIPATSRWHAETQFRLALTYLAQEKTVEAQLLLQKISASDSPFSADSTGILEEL